MSCDPTTSKAQTEGIETLIHCLPQLTKLKSLKISNNYQSQCNFREAEPYYQNLSYTIGQLQALRALDLSGAITFDAEYLGKGLEKSHCLTFVNLGTCWEASQGKWQGGIELINGLKVHPHLIYLNLQNNPIGFDPSGRSDPNSTYALADAFSSWSQLQSLNLADNRIGYEAPNSTSYFLKKLAELATTVNSRTGKTLEVNLFSGIYNITWTREAHVFQNLTENAILKACAKQLCSGGFLPNNTELTLAPVTSSTSRPIPFYQPVISSLKSWFSLKSWSTSFDKALDSVTHVIQSYSKHVVKNSPTYFSGTVDSDKSLVEGSKEGCFNETVPHFRVLDQSPHQQTERLNYVQKLNHTSSPLMLSSGSHPLALSK